MQKTFLKKYLLILVFISTCSVFPGKVKGESHPGSKQAYFAGGCFWCIESSFEKVKGVYEAVSGYTDGKVKNPTYKMVSGGSTRYIEAVKVIYDPEKITYKELVDKFWSFFNPMDEGGSFYDRGHQYTSGIFYQDKSEKTIADKSKKTLVDSKRYPDSIVTPIIPLKNWYDAEEYHQDYYKKNPGHYQRYRSGSGRDDFIQRYWGDNN